MGLPQLFHKLCTSIYLALRYFSLSSHRYLQEAQLSQKVPAMLRVTEYFAMSLKAIRNDTVE